MAEDIFGFTKAINMKALDKASASKKKKVMKILDVGKETQGWGNVAVTYNYHTGVSKSAMKKYKSSWCKCNGLIPEQLDFSMYEGEGLCNCGIRNHHIHCKKCGGVTQVG